jgi:hypothetical protein
MRRVRIGNVPMLVTADPAALAMTLAATVAVFQSMIGMIPVLVTCSAPVSSISSGRTSFYRERGHDSTAVADQLQLDELKWYDERVEPGLSPPWPWHAGS